MHFFTTNSGKIWGYADSSGLEEDAPSDTPSPTPQRVRTVWPGGVRCHTCVRALAPVAFQTVEKPWLTYGNTYTHIENLEHPCSANNI
jgi:hypothetical protein